MPHTVRPGARLAAAGSQREGEATRPFSSSPLLDQLGLDERGTFVAHDYRGAQGVDAPGRTSVGVRTPGAAILPTTM